MTDSAALEQMNSVRYLYLREIYEPDENALNTLRIVVREAALNYRKNFDAPPKLGAL
ncbi:MAG: hypothetical protein ABSD96_14345 [Candidatus Korobacteraceae bacterium]|jgi:hypothetical protein